MCLKTRAGSWGYPGSPGRRLYVVILLLVLAPGILVAQNATLGDSENFFDVSFGDLQEELTMVNEEGKAAPLIMFEMEDCPWCDRMKKQVLNRVQVQDYYHQNFRIVSVDVEGDVPIIDFDGSEILSKDYALKVLRVRATPVFVFFDPRGEVITRYTGVVKNAHDFILLGRYIVEGHHKTTRFNQFRRANQPG